MRLYIPTDVCADRIYFDVAEGRVKGVVFIGGCPGNTQGVSRLVEGMEVGEAIARLRGIECDGKETSCPDQLALVLEEVYNKK